MAELKSTPGPWHVAADHDYSLGQAVRGEDYAVCYAQTPMDRNGARHEIREANARLIAAAPALYEALADLVESWRAPDGSLPRGPKCVRAYNAIKQARGEA